MSEHLNLFGTGPVFSEDPAMGFWLDEDQRHLIVFGFFDDHVDKLKQLMTMNMRNVAIIADIPRFAAQSQFLEFVSWVAETFPETSVKLYVRLPVSNPGESIGAFGLFKTRFRPLESLYMNPKLTITLFGYEDWLELKDRVDGINQALTNPDEPRFFLGKEF